jgi:hypothetical protein
MYPDLARFEYARIGSVIMVMLEKMANLMSETANPGHLGI